MSHYVMAKKFALKSSYAYIYNDEDWTSVSDSNTEYRTGSRGYRFTRKCQRRAAADSLAGSPYSLKEHMSYLNTTFL